VKVLHIIDNFGFGGAELLLATLGTAAPSAGFAMSVACLGPRTPERSVTLPILEEAGVTPGFVGVRRLLDPWGLPRLRRAILRSGCDVVHAHLGYATALVPLAARLAGVPCVSTLHHVPTSDVPRGQLVKEWLWTRSGERGSALVFVSDAARRAAAELVGQSRPTWKVIHNGVDLARFRVRPGDRVRALPPDLPVPAGAPVVTVVAALRAPKGHEVALRAWPAVRAAVPGAVLLIVGDGPHEPALRALAGDGVVFAGSRRDVPEILEGTTVALLPSLTEALPTTLIEAAAAGVPVVATTVGGTPETVEHGRTGLLVPPGDDAALAGAVIDLLRDPARRAEFGTAGRLLAEQRFDLKLWATRLADLYGDTVDRYRAPARLGETIRRRREA
jgi:glycosyltransferase involved in cell wall biosynthesis